MTLAEKLALRRLQQDLANKPVVAEAQPLIVKEEKILSFAERMALKKQSAMQVDAYKESLPKNDAPILSPLDALKNESNTNISTLQENAPKSVSIPLQAVSNTSLFNIGKNTQENAQTIQQSITKEEVLTVIQDAQKTLTFAEKMALRKAEKKVEVENVLPLLNVEQRQVVEKSLPPTTIPSLTEMVMHREKELGRKMTLVEKINYTKEYKTNLELMQTMWTVNTTQGEEVLPEEVNAGNTVTTNYPDTDLVPNIAVAIKESLSEKLKRIAREKAGHIPQPEATPYDATKEEVEAEVKKPSLNEMATTNQTISPTFTNKATFSLDIILNDKQQAAVDLIGSGKSAVLLGAAGTGKTSSEREMLKALLELDTMRTTSFKLSGDSRVEAPSVAVVAYTRRAASNSAKAILKDPILANKLTYNIMTIHALLEFVPVEYYDEVEKKMMFRFLPQRHKDAPLTITHLIIEEATLVGLDLWEQLFDALPHGCKIVFVGDINQLPPVFGPSILNYAITRLPVVELTQVYRQGEGSPIITNAHRILEGKFIESGTTDQGKLIVISGKNERAVGQEKTVRAVSSLLEQFYDKELYSPEEDMILCPYNKQPCGTINLNYYIAEFLSKRRKAVVYHIIAGFNSLYLAEGDKVMFNKRDAIIVEINRNPSYVGKEPMLHGSDLSRFGVRRVGENSDTDLEDFDLVSSEETFVRDYSDMSLEEIKAEAANRVFQASHKITIAYETGNTEVISSAGDLNDSNFQLGYAMTVHKSQGSEWRRVFCLFHPDQQRNLSREMLYTAITRAREECYLISKQAILDRTVEIQRVRGNTLADKIAYFNSGVEQNDSVQVVKE